MRRPSSFHSIPSRDRTARVGFLDALVTLVSLEPGMLHTSRGRGRGTKHQAQIHVSPLEHGKGAKSCSWCPRATGLSSRKLPVTRSRHRHLQLHRLSPKPAARYSLQDALFATSKRRCLTTSGRETPHARIRYERFVSRV